MIIKNKKNKLRTIVIVAGVLMLLLATGVSAYVAFRPTNNPEANKAAQDNRYVSGGINYSPPTDEEKAMNAEQEQKNKERERLDQLPPATTAEVTISDGNQYGDTIEVRAFISNLLENGGICTATFTKTGAFTITSTSTAFSDAKTTQCGALDTPRSKFSTAGKWTVVVSYKSPQATGNSNSQTIEIK